MPDCPSYFEEFIEMSEEDQNLLIADWCDYSYSHQSKADQKSDIILLLSLGYQPAFEDEVDDEGTIEKRYYFINNKNELDYCSFEQLPTNKEAK
ncbi:MAG: hypothetical protein ACRCZK_00585 [Oscillospiraceae bacterium]